MNLREAIEEAIESAFQFAYRTGKDGSGHTRSDIIADLVMQVIPANIKELYMGLKIHIEGLMLVKETLEGIPEPTVALTNAIDSLDKIIGELSKLQNLTPKKPQEHGHE